MSKAAKRKNTADILKEQKEDRKRFFAARRQQASNSGSPVLGNVSTGLKFSLGDFDLTAGITSGLSPNGGVMSGPLGFNSKEVTIASDKITIASAIELPTSYIIVNGEGGNADDLKTIITQNVVSTDKGAWFRGQLLFLQAKNANITLKHNASGGNVWIPSGSDLTLNKYDSSANTGGTYAILMWDDQVVSTSGKWVLVASGASTSSSSGATRELDNLQNTAVNADIDPSSNNTRDLGNSTKQWKNIWIDGVAYIDSLGFGDTLSMTLPTGVASSGQALVASSSSALAWSSVVSAGDDITFSGDNTFSGNVIFDTTATGSESSAPIKFQGDGANTAQRIMELGKEGLHQIKVIGEIQGVAPFTIQNPDGSGANDYTIPSNGQGMNIDTSIVMNTHNIYDLDQLVFARGTSSLTPTWNDDFIGFEFTQDNSYNDTGLGYHVDANLRHRFHVHGDEILTISNEAITAGADSSYIGIHVSTNTGKGTKGQMEAPYNWGSSYPSSSDLDTWFGTDSGSIGVFRHTSNTDRFYFRTGYEGWNYVDADGQV